MRRPLAPVAPLALCAAAAFGQSPGPMARVAYLGPSADTAPKLLQAFKDGLAARGYEEGRNIVIEYRWTNVGANMNDDATLVASVHFVNMSTARALGVTVPQSVRMLASNVLP